MNKAPGLTDEQLTELVARVHQRTGALTSRGRPFALGLFKSVALVIMLIRRNITQQFAAGIFGISQSTLSRRWGLLRPVIGAALAEFVPDPTHLIGAGTALVEGTICPTWNWQAHPRLFSGKTGYPGINVQIAADLDGNLVAVGTTRSQAPATTRMPSAHRASPTPSPTPTPQPTWAISASTEST